jgi:hypothetical protein
VLAHSLPQGLNLVFHLFFIAGSLAMILIRHEIFHKIFAVLSAVLFLGYIVELFGYLH